MLDILGYPLKVGDTILTTNYGSGVLDLITTVEKVNKKSVTVVVTVNGWDWKEKKATSHNKKMRRDRNQVIAIDHQLAYIQEHHPENLL